MYAIHFYFLSLKRTIDITSRPTIVRNYCRRGCAVYMKFTARARRRLRRGAERQVLKIT